MAGKGISKFKGVRSSNALFLVERKLFCRCFSSGLNFELYNNLLDMTLKNNHTFHFPCVFKSKDEGGV